MYQKMRLVMAIVLLASALFIGKTVSVVVSGSQVEKKDIENIVILDAGHGGCR